MVPASTRALVKLPHRRKRWFHQHLAKVIAEVMERRRSHGAAVALPENESAGAPQFTAEPPRVLAGCTVCRGHCCRLGGIKAFLDTLTIERFMQNHPQLRPRDVLRAYM